MQIVSNKFCEIDVDKYDYLERDLYYLRNAVQFRCNPEFFKRAKVVRDKGCTHIAYSLEDKDNIQSFFNLRHQLRENVYMHPNVEYGEKQFCDILQEAMKNGFTFKGWVNCGFLLWIKMTNKMHALLTGKK